MRRVIRYLRRQNEETRVQILYVLTIASALLLLVFWLNAFDANSKTTSQNVNTENNEPTPFSILKDGLSDRVKSLEIPW